MKVDHYTRKLVRLRKVANHIDTHLGQPITLDALADIANMSRFHFERVFNEYAGETPLARVRRLRLEKAREHIEQGHTSSLLELALECGYASAEAFSRAFRNCHGISPSETRQRVRICLPEQIRIESLPALPIQYIPYAGILDDSIEPFDELRARALIAGIPRERRKGWCIQLAGDMGNPVSSVQLQIGLLSERLGTTIPGLNTGRLPQGHYAVLRVVGSYATPSNDALALRIAGETGWNMVDGPILRCFQNSTYLPAQFERQCDIYIPVMR
jgi:AraC family transcriptional regulator